MKKQIKDLRTRLLNLASKKEMAEELPCDKDTQIGMLQRYIVAREQKVN